MLQNNSELNYNLVKNIFYYQENDNTGYLIWKENRAINKIKIGDIAGSFNKRSGYYHLQLNKKKYLLHRIIFLWHHGYLPEYIDHIDKNKLNNKISNLRKTNLQLNQRNSKQRKSLSEIKGVNWFKRDSKWYAIIYINKKKYYLGSYDNFDDAVLARYKKECEVNWNESEDSPAYNYLKKKNLI